MAKFPWGEQAFVMPSAFVGLLVGAIVAATVLVIMGPYGTVTDDAFPNPKQLQPLAVASGFFWIVWYGLLGNQVGAKTGKFKNDDQKDQAKLIADRGVMNTLEQMMPFFVLVWLNALFVNPRTAAALAWIFSACRFFYPITYGMFGEMNSAVELVQWPCYVVNFYLLIALLFKTLNGQDLQTVVTNVSPVLMYGVTLLAGIGTLLNFIVVPTPAKKAIQAGVKWNMEFVDEEAALMGNSQK